MKSIKTFALAATILTSTLGAFPKHASAAVDAFLFIKGVPQPQSVTLTPVIVSVVVSLLLK